RNELERTDEPADGMLPADERLELDDAARVEREHWLIIELEYAALDRVAQVGLETEPRVGAVVHLAVEHAVPVRAHRLGARPSDAGLLEQSRRRLELAHTVSDAGARRGEHLAGGRLDRLAQRVLNAQGDANGVVLAANRLE